MSVDAMQSTETSVGAATAAIPRHIRELFGEPPLLRSESRGAYDALRSALAVQFDPRETADHLCGRQTQYDHPRAARSSGGRARAQGPQ